MSGQWFFRNTTFGVGHLTYANELGATQNTGATDTIPATLITSALDFCIWTTTADIGLANWPTASAGDPYQAVIDVDEIGANVSLDAANSAFYRFNTTPNATVDVEAGVWDSTTGTGLKTYSDTSWAPSSGATTDKAAFGLAVATSNTMMDNTISISCNDGVSYLKGPWLAAEGVAFRGYADDGAIGSATPKAAQDTGWDQAVDEAFRVRFLVQLSAFTDDPLNQYSYHYRRNGGSWIDITTSSTFIHVADSATAEGATTSLLTGGSGTFAAGEFIESSAISDGDAIPVDGYTEHVVNLIMVGSDGWQDGDTLDVRISRPAAAITSVEAPINVTAGGGGTGYTQPLTATLSFTVTTVKKGRKPLTASISPAATIARETRHLLSATLAPAGALAKKTKRALTGALSFSSAGTASLRRLLALSADLDFSGAVSREGRKVLAGSLTPAGSLTCRARKVLAGSLSPAGAITRRTRRALSAVLDFTGGFNAVLQGGAQQFEEAFNATLDFTTTVTRRTGKVLAATLSPAGAVAAATRYRRALTATLTSDGALRRSTGRALSATLSPGGSLARRTHKLLTAALSPAGDLTAQLIGALAIAFNATLSFTTAAQARTSKVLDAVSASLDFSGSLATAGVFHRALTASLDFAASVQRSTSRSIAAAIGPSGALTRTTRRALAATLSFAGSFAEELLGPLSIAFNATLSFAGSTTRRTSHLLAGALSPAGSLAASARHRLSLTASLVLTSALARQTSRALTAALTPAGELNRLTRRALSATVSFVGAIVTRTITPLRSRGVTAARNSGAIVARVRTAVARSSGSTSSRDRGSTGPRD